METPRDGNPLAIGLDHRRDWPLLFDAAAKAPYEIDLVCNPDMLRGLNVPSNVNLIRTMPMVDLREKISCARFVVLPVKQNAYTGATITLLQCMAAGSPVIVTKTSAIEEGYPFRDNENCLLVAPGDGKQLAEAMNRLYTDGNLCEAIGDKAQKTVRAENDIAHYVARLDSIIKEVHNQGAYRD
jgi:glycosyltransferase involved in cell wall biosynthesis